METSYRNTVLSSFALARLLALFLFLNVYVCFF